MSNQNQSTRKALWVLISISNNFIVLLYQARCLRVEVLGLSLCRAPKLDNLVIHRAQYSLYGMYMVMWLSFCYWSVKPVIMKRRQLPLNFAAEYAAESQTNQHPKAHWFSVKSSKSHLMRLILLTKTYVKLYWLLNLSRNNWHLKNLGFKVYFVSLSSLL